MQVDGPARSCPRGAGHPVTFAGNESELGVRCQLGDTIYLDVAHLDPEFSGDLKVGVHGKLRHILLEAIGQ